MAEEKECTIITTFDGLMNPMPAPEKFIQAVKKISVGDTVELNGLTRHLVELDMRKLSGRDDGEFSVRGGIIDIFPLTEETPFRIELWGDEVDSIRSFDPESQRSIENLEEIYIYPACELVLTEEERRNGVAKIQKEAEKNCREVPQRDENRGGLPHKVHGRPDCGRDDGVRHYRRTGRLSVLFLRWRGYL